MRWFLIVIALPALTGVAAAVLAAPHVGRPLDGAVAFAVAFVVAVIAQRRFK